MCGIAGIVTKKGAAPSRAKLEAMVKSIKHRGPDDEGFYFHENAALGHRRLSIIDLSSLGHQPMPSHDGKLWITFNGEIYNYLELKKELGKIKFKSGSDTEVLLAAYQKWGERAPKKLNGIFSFAIWDERSKSLFCARDHVGVKPFYYAFQNGVFYFASEIKALLAAGVRTRPNDKIIYDYLAYGYYQHSDETFFEGIYQLPAGNYLTFRSGKINIVPYWELSEDLIDTRGWGEKRAVEEFIDLFTDAVKIQLRSDVQVSIQLSGGLDSSMVAAMVNKIAGGQKKFRTLSFVYGNYKDKELPYIKLLAKGLGWAPILPRFFAQDMPRMMQEVTWHQDEPFPGLPTFGQHLINSISAKEHAPVTLGGQGGDEIGAGYEYYMGAFLLDVLSKDGSEKLWSELKGYGEKHSVSDEGELAKIFMNGLAAYFDGGTSADASKFTNTDVLGKSFRLKAEHPLPKFSAPFDSNLRNMQYRDILYTKLPRILHSADRSSMAYGVEHRVPLLDYRLVRLGLSLADDLKIRDGEQRFFMRRASRSILPKKVYKAPKRAVPSPQREWFKTSLRPWILSVLSSKSFGKREYFDQEKILSEYGKYCRTPGVPANSFHVWQWLHLEIWLRTFFD